jgi:Rieske Fe-S protein
MTRHQQPPRARSKLTTDRNMPGAFEGETVSRRRFMTTTAHTAGGVAAAAFTLPALGFAIGPIFERPTITWQELLPLADVPSSTYKPVVFTLEPGIGEAGRSLLYLRRHVDSIDGPPKDKYDHVIAISDRCAHVGCPVRFVESAATFVCPCHAGVYDFLGRRVGGPPPRPLDRFYTLVRDGVVLLGPRYSLNNELRRFSARDPGQPLDGIGQFLYPARFDTESAPPGAKP